MLKRAPGGEVVPLTPKAFELLLILVESKGVLLTKADLMNRVWAESFVEEGNLGVFLFLNPVNIYHRAVDVL